MRIEKVVFVTVSDDRSGRKGGKYSETQDKVLNLFKNNSTFGITDFHFWKWKDIKDSEFYMGNKKMLDHIDPAMNGRCYKPFAISEAMKSVDDGDFVIYNDISPEWWREWDPEQRIHPRNYKLDVIKNLCVQNGGILTSDVTWYSNGTIADHTHENFTLERCIDKMGMQDYKYSLQHASGMIVLQKSKKSMDFVNEWLYWNLIDECASLGSVENDPVLPEDGISEYWHEEVTKYGKIGHRHDQSISGLLINKMGNKLVNNLQNYNFLSFCKVDFPYTFTESNIPKSEHVYRNIFDGEKWEYLRFEREKYEQSN